MFSLSTFFQVIPHEQAVQRFAEATEKAAINDFCHAIANETLERYLFNVGGPSVPVPRRPVGRPPGSFNVSGLHACLCCRHSTDDSRRSPLGNPAKKRTRNGAGAALEPFWFLKPGRAQKPRYTQKKIGPNMKKSAQKFQLILDHLGPLSCVMFNLIFVFLL